LEYVVDSLLECLNMETLREYKIPRSYLSEPEKIEPELRRICDEVVAAVNRFSSAVGRRSTFLEASGTLDARLTSCCHFLSDEEIRTVVAGHVQYVLGNGKDAMFVVDYCLPDEDEDVSAVEMFSVESVDDSLVREELGVAVEIFVHEVKDFLRLAHNMSFESSNGDLQRYLRQQRKLIGLTDLIRNDIRPFPKQMVIEALNANIGRIAMADPYMIDVLSDLGISAIELDARFFAEESASVADDDKSRPVLPVRSRPLDWSDVENILARLQLKSEKANGGSHFWVKTADGSHVARLAPEGVSGGKKTINSKLLLRHLTIGRYGGVALDRADVVRIMSEVLRLDRVA